MINNDLYFTFIKISSNYRNLIVCKYWYKNIIKDIKKKKIDFYDIQLYNAINNKHLFLLYKPFDNIILNAYNNIILKSRNHHTREFLVVLPPAPPPVALSKGFCVLIGVVAPSFRMVSSSRNNPIRSSFFR